MTETTFYLLYPIRKSKLGYKKMRLFYLFLGFLWIIGAVYLVFNNPTGTIAISVVYLVIGLFLEVMAFFYPIVILGRYIRINENNLDIYLSPLNKVVMQWEQMNSIQIKDKTLYLESKDGKSRKFRLGKLDNLQWNLFNKKLKEVVEVKKIMLQ